MEDRFGAEHYSIPLWKHHFQKLSLFRNQGFCEKIHRFLFLFLQFLMIV